jgi:hypothetical protein
MSLSGVFALAEARTVAVLVRERACPSTVLALLPEPQPDTP